MAKVSGWLIEQRYAEACAREAAEEAWLAQYEAECEAAQQQRWDALQARLVRAQQANAKLKPLAKKGRRLSDRGSLPWAVWHGVVLTLADAYPEASLQDIWFQIRRRVKDNPTIIVNAPSARVDECDYVVGRACVDGGHIHWRSADGVPLRSVGREAVLNFVSKNSPRRAR